MSKQNVKVYYILSIQNHRKDIPIICIASIKCNINYGKIVKKEKKKLVENMDQKCPQIIKLFLVLIFAAILQYVQYNYNYTVLRYG